jgi:hypothetical protein
MNDGQIPRRIAIQGLHCLFPGESAVFTDRLCRTHLVTEFLLSSATGWPDSTDNDHQAAAMDDRFESPE